MLPFSSVSLLAVVVATIVSFVIGWIWHGPLFGKSWMQLVGIKMPAKMDAKVKKIMCKSMTQGLINTFLGTYILALALALVAPASLQDGLVYGTLLWVGFCATSESNWNIWVGKPWGLFLINSGYRLVTILVSVAILMSWAS